MIKLLPLGKFYGIIMFKMIYFICQHFREHLDKLFAKGIGLLGEALTEAFTILNDVSFAALTSDRQFNADAVQTFIRPVETVLTQCMTNRCICFC